MYTVKLKSSQLPTFKQQDPRLFDEINKNKVAKSSQFLDINKGGGANRPKKQI